MKESPGGLESEKARESIDEQISRSGSPQDLKVSDIEWEQARTYFSQIKHDNEKNTGFFSKTIINQFCDDLNAVSHNFTAINGTLYAVQGVEFLNPDGTPSGLSRGQLTKEQRKKIKYNAALGHGHFGVVLKVQDQKGRQFAIKKLKFHGNTLSASLSASQEYDDSSSSTTSKMTDKNKLDIVCLKNELLLSLKAHKAIDGLIREDKKIAYIVMPIYHKNFQSIFNDLISNITTAKHENLLHLLKETISIFEKIILEVKEINENYGILHADITPSNFMIDENNNFHLIDYGLSTMLPKEEGKYITSATVIHFTTHFSNNAAPEVYPIDQSIAQHASIQAKYSIQSEIYSTGNIFKKILFAFEDQLEQHSIYARLRQFTNKMTAAETRNRFKSWSEVMAQFNKIQHDVNILDNIPPKNLTPSPFAKVPFIGSFMNFSGSYGNDASPHPKEKEIKNLAGSDEGQSELEMSGYQDTFKPSIGSNNNLNNLYNYLIDLKKICDNTEEIFYDCKGTLEHLSIEYQTHTEAADLINNVINVLEQTLTSNKAPFIASQEKLNVTKTNQEIAKILQALIDKIGMLNQNKSKKPWF